jgi:hypothetical protein
VRSAKPVPRKKKKNTNSVFGAVGKALSAANRKLDFLRGGEVRTAIVNAALGCVAVFVALCVRAFFVHVLNTPMPGIPAAILLGVLGSYAGQIGDLVASLLKRYTGIKDYGKIFPGHGGVMDRFDSIIFVLIVMYCYTLVL